MDLIQTPESKIKLSEALRQMEEALEVLDEFDAPGEIGSNLDLAIARLERFLGQGSESRSNVQNLIEEAERELAAVKFRQTERSSPWEMSPS